MMNCKLVWDTFLGEFAVLPSIVDLQLICGAITANTDGCRANHEYLLR